MTARFVSRGRGRLHCAVLLAAACVQPVAAATPEELRGHYRELTENVDGNPFGAPLSVQSTEGSERVTAEVYGVFDAPLDQVAAAIAAPDGVCDFIALNIFIKACTWRARSDTAEMTWYMGRKNYEDPDPDNVIVYTYAVTARTDASVQVTLRAPEALMGVKDSVIVFDALGIDGKTLVHVHAGYTPSLQSRLAMGTYLATFGRNKIGFTTVPGGDGKSEPVKGAQALIERNTMRYFLALQAHLDTRAEPPDRREAAAIERWFDLTEKYHDVLYEIPREEFIANKTRERRNAAEMQRNM